MSKKIKLLIFIVALFIGIGLGFLAFYSHSVSPVDSTSDDSFVFVVEEGQTSEIVLNNLYEKKLIRNELMAKVCMRLEGLSDIKAGHFVLSQSMSTKELLKDLNDNLKAKSQEVSVTFKEGMWAKEIASLIEKKLGIKSESLLSLWNDDEFLKELVNKYDFLTDELLNKDYKVKLEGYLFPETYNFPVDADEKTITTIFLDQFNKVYLKYKEDFAKSKYSIHELVTLASVVQYEAASKNDMELIAGVFYNRLNKDMKLQSSVTVCYSLYDKLTSADDCEIYTDIDSPYNTYEHKGLPIGPILNPGEDAIQAVLNPKESKYLYFVADIYGDGSVHYAETFEEHDANVDKYNLRK